MSQIPTAPYRPPSPLKIVNQTAPAEPDVDIALDFVVMDETAQEQPYKVIIHNDNVTPFDFVIAVLNKFFYLSIKQAAAIAYQAHTSGLALVTVLPYKDAHQRVYKVQSLARDLGYPLRFTLEPDD